MINRREWIERCIAAAGVAMLDTAGMPEPVPSEDDEQSSFCVEDLQRFAKHYGMTYHEQGNLTTYQWRTMLDAIPFSHPKNIDWANVVI
jgi:hypothetical protein